VNKPINPEEFVATVEGMVAGVGPAIRGLLTAFRPAG